MEIPVPKALRNLTFNSLRSKPRKKLPKAVLTADIATSLLPKKKPKQALTADKFTDIEDGAALVLSSHQGPLSLNGLNSLSDASAEALSKHGDSLYLNGLTSLSEAAATSLARHHDKLYLNGIEHVSDAVAGALSKHKGDLLLNGISHLSDASALMLSRRTGWLHLDGLNDFPDTPGHVALAHNLAARHVGTLAVNEVKALPLTIFKILTTHQGRLELNGLESIPKEGAKFLSKREHLTYMLGLLVIDEEIEVAIHERQRDFVFNSEIERPFEIFRPLPSTRFESLFPSSDDLKESKLIGEKKSKKTRPSVSDQSMPPEAEEAQFKKEAQDDSAMNDDDETWVAEENEALNQVSDISEREREIYRAYMGWNAESALSFAKVGKRYSITASAARTICDRVEQRMRASKLFKPEPFHRSPPCHDESAPRDGKPLRKTEDLLFLALMLEKLAKTGWMETTRDEADRVTYRIIPKPLAPAVKGQQFWKTKTLKEVVWNLGFWEVRRLRRRPDGHRIKVPRGLELKFPVRRGADPLLSSPSWVEHFRSWSEVEDLVIKAGEIICPLCGPMPPLIVTVISPKETWSMGCGREYDFSCCSGCLGTFGNRVTRMN